MILHNMVDFVGQHAGQLILILGFGNDAGCDEDVTVRYRESIDFRAIDQDKPEASECFWSIRRHCKCTTDTADVLFNLGGSNSASGIFILRCWIAIERCSFQNRSCNHPADKVLFRWGKLKVVCFMELVHAGCNVAQAKRLEDIATSHEW